MDCSTPGFHVLHYFPEFAQTLMSVESVTPSSDLILCCPFSSCPQSFPASETSRELALRIRWPNYWSLSFSISPSNEYSELISFRIHWFDFLVVQGTLKSLLQHHSSKTSILQCSVFFMIQLSHLYVTTGKAIALNIWTFVGKVMAVLFNILFRLVIAFLPRSKHFLIPWLQSPSAVISESLKSFTVSTVFPSNHHKVM